MHPEQFIERNVAQILTEGGYSPEVVRTATQEALKTFRSTPCFGKGQAFGVCLAQAKKMAKLLQRKQRQQEREAKKVAKTKRSAPIMGVPHG